MAPILPFRVGGPLAEVAWRYAWTVPVVALLGLIGSALEGVGIGLLIPLITTLLANQQVHVGQPFDSLIGIVARFDPQTRLLAIAGAILLFIALKNLVAFINNVFIAWIDGRASHDIRNALAARLFSVGYPFFLAEDPARLVNIIATESWKGSDAIRAIFSAIASFGSIAVFTALLLIIDARLTLLVIAGTLFIRFVQSRLIAGLAPFSRELTQANGQLAEGMLRAVWAMRLIRIYGQEHREQQRFDSASERVRRIIYRLSAHQARVSPVQEVLHATLFVALLVGTIIFEGGVPLPALIAFLVLLQRMQPHLRNLESARAEIAASEGSVREVEWLLDPAGKPEPASGALAIDAFESGIEFRNVEFRYATRPDAAPALVDASFSIRAGRSTAVIGASGAGKSTIVNLLCRLCEPTGGEILVNHTRLADIDPWQWRRKIGLAGQDIELLEGSIAENIAFGAPEATREEIEQAAHIADADGFISELPDGYETDVGSRGISLSGGQRQRISLARALVRRPELLILDEATNAVDALSEASIIKRLRDLGSHMTVVVISHRPSTLASCDDGIVLDAGVVKESGPLESLRAYRSMFSARDSGSRDLR